MSALSGRTPTWVFFAARLDPTNARVTFPPDGIRHAALGWRDGVTWLVRRVPGLRVTVTITRKGGGVALMNLVGTYTTRPASTMTLDADNPDRPPEQAAAKYVQIGGSIFFPRSGCYTLKTQSRLGSWTMNFGFGSSG